MSVSVKVKELVEDYVGLSDDERHEFFTLVAPVDDGPISGAWSRELNKRVQDIDEGRIQLIDGEDFLHRFRATI